MALIEKFIEFEKPKDTTTKEVMTKSEIKKASYDMRTMGNIRVAAEAQRVFNPGLPPTKPKAPTAAQQSSGVAPAMSTSGNWGQPPQ